MAHKKERLSVYKGRFHRTLGKVLNERGELVAKKFLLGTDQAAAEVANRLLEKLWEEVVAEHEAAVRFLREMGGPLGDCNVISGVVDYQRLRRVDHGPVWREESLMIAEAIRRGQREIAVQVGSQIDADRYVERIVDLRRTYTVIAFVPASAQVYARGQEVLASQARSLVEEAQDLSATAQVPFSTATGQTLYQALDAYGKYVTQANLKEFGINEAASAQRLKAAHPDIPLEQLGISAMERMAAYWAARPIAKKTGKPVALNTVTNHLKTARRFVRWLHRTDAFHWSKPVDAEESLRVRVERLRTDAEIAELGSGVKVWDIKELVALYHYATDQERLFMLLGLNCGFAHSEICSLRHDEIAWEAKRATIKRVRRKNRVYSQFALWPETITAIKWLTAQQKNIPPQDAPYVMITPAGRRFGRQHIGHLWNRLLDRVQVDHPTFRRLSFKHLRKTAGQLVRERSDGEISGVFLSHGRAVVSDDLADVYTNRPFGKVAATLEQVHRDLQPMFDAAKGDLPSREAEVQPTSAGG
jgi:integrase